MISRNNIRKASFFKPVLIAVAFLFLSISSFSQYFFNENCQQAYRSVILLRFKEARQKLQSEKQQNPTNLVPVYLENYIDFLTLFIGEDRAEFEKLKSLKSKRIHLLEDGREDSPFYRFCLGEVHLQWAFARLKFGEYTAAALEIRKAYQLFSENEERFPTFLPNKIGLGVVHVTAGIVPDNYRWIANLMGVEGSMENGLGEIYRVASYSGKDESVQLFQPEAIFYLATIAANLQKNKRSALPIIQLIQSRDYGQDLTESPLMIYGRTSILMKNGLNDEALKILQQRTLDDQQFPFCYLDYMEGLCRLNRLDMGSADCFHRYLQHFKGLNYIRSAYQKLAWIALLQGDSAKYRYNLTMILRFGNSFVDEDKQALFEASKGIPPNVILLRSRLLFDGGYFELALKELLDNSVKKYLKTHKDLVEYTYRLARIYHEQGNTAQALDHYRQTILRGKNDPWYYAAASAYQMGLIYENSGLVSQADSSYRVCLSIKTGEYKTSLSQKAKAGLNRLRKINP